LANTKFKVETGTPNAARFLPEGSQKKPRCTNRFWGYVGGVDWRRMGASHAVLCSVFCDIVTFIMALTKVSSTAHFVSRNAAVGGRGGNAISGRWAPNTDVYVADDGLVVKVEMAGMKSDSLEITVEGNRLRIAGNRPDGCRAGKCNFLVMEISYGPFESVLELPPGYDLSRAKAVYLNGFLRIDVPVALRPHPKMTKVPIVGGN
jgi:HSP20 family protein